MGSAGVFLNGWKSQRLAFVLRGPGGEGVDIIRAVLPISTWAIAQCERSISPNTQDSNAVIASPNFDTPCKATHLLENDETATSDNGND